MCATVWVYKHSYRSFKFAVDRQNLNPNHRKRLRILGPITYNRFTSISLVLLMNADLSINIFVLSRFNLSLLASLDSLYVEKVAWVCFCLFIKSRLALADPSTLSAAGCLLACFLILPVHDEEGNIYRLYVFPIQAFTQLHKSKLKKLKFYNKKLYSHPPANDTPKM